MTGDWQSMSWGELLASLRRDLQLDPSTDFGGGVLQALTAAGARVATGTATVTWDGVHIFTNAVTITHGLPSTPTCAVATGNWDTHNFAAGVGSVGATTFQVAGQTTDGSVPAAGTSTLFWLALV